MQAFQRVAGNITRCTFTPEDTKEISNASAYIDQRYMSGELVGQCPANVKDISFTPRDVYKYTPDGPPHVVTVKTVDGQKTYIDNLTKEYETTSYRARLDFAFLEGERVYGLGQDEDGVLNKRGHKEYLYQHNMKIPMPMLVSSMGYAVLFNCGCMMVFDDTGENAHITLECVEQADFFVITGSMDEIVAGYRMLTGTASAMPSWVFGYMQSKERYQTQDELLAVAKKHRETGIPLDVIVQDWKTWEGELWGDKNLDKARYPDISKALQELHGLDIRALISVWPNMNAGGSNHAEFLDKGMLLNDYSTYDAFDSEARNVYWRQAERELYSGGFDGWWCDSTEPFAAPDWGGETKLGEAERYQLVGGEHERYLGPANANLYALMHARGMYENQPQKPVVNLTRSGFAGIQKYGAILWAGDTSATWEELRREIAKGLSISMCGIPYWTVDAGAFFAGGTKCWRKWKGDPAAPPVWFWNGNYDEGVKDKGYQELYTRWLQFACFLPVFRSHGTDTPREAWEFEPPFYDAIVKTIKLRYHLAPYILEMARRVTAEHYTIMRSLLFDFPDDENACDISDEFMFGENILVCPVTKPFYYGSGSVGLTGAAMEWECYLPKGTAWYNYWDHARYEGGQTVKVPVALEQIPLFVRAGTRLPTQNGLQSMTQSESMAVEYEVFPE